ncbi:MAG: aminomethyltransferase [Planctomycetaceae bacterium]|nr:MAG: aminomethyltransferase [Planctomycetaceae bacterium]
MTSLQVAVQHALAGFPLPQWSVIAVRGGDRLRFIHNFCTQHVQSLMPGQGGEAYFCNVKGKIIGHATILVGADTCWVIGVPGLAQRLLPHLERYIIRDDVTLQDISTAWELWHLIGPQGPPVYQRLQRDMGGSGAVPNACHLETTSSASATSLVFWTDTIGLATVAWFGGQEGLLMVRRDDSERSADIPLALRQLAASGDVVVGSPAEWHRWRIWAGFPLDGVDFDQSRLPQEVGRMSACVSFRKGCYLGQEPIARLDALGHTNQELRRLASPEELDSSWNPAAHELMPTESEQPVGWLTSWAPHPLQPGTIAWGYIKTAWQTPGTSLTTGQHLWTVLPPAGRG